MSKVLSKKRVAVFDIDGTIFRSSLIIELVHMLIQDGLLPAHTPALYEGSYRRWLDRKGSYERYINALVHAYIAHVKGVPRKKVLIAAGKVMAYHKNRVYRYTRDLVRDLKRKKYLLIAISNSPQDIVEPFARSFGFDSVYARVYEADKKGRLTGKVLHADLIGNKARVLRHAVEKFGLTLNDSIGVGDTEVDIPMLRIVQHPIAFNPNSKLYREAKKRGWRIVVERKDVVYTL